MNGKNLKNSFCILPFTSIDARDKTIIGPCCKSRLNNTYNEIDQYWDSEELKSLRLDLLNGIKNPICNECWKLESLGLKSLRLNANQRFKKEYVKNPKLVELNYNPGKECNLACMMCSADHSSRFSSLWKGQMVPPPSQIDDVDNHKKVSRWIYLNYQQLESLTVNGGEPLYNKRFMQLIDFLLDKNVAHNIMLYITTNGTILPDSTVQKLKKFKQVIFTVSIEAVGAPNDYIRWFGNFDSISQNIKILNQEFSVSLQPTISALNIVHLPKLEQFCYENGYTLGIANRVEMWDQLLPENLPEQIKKLVDQKYKNLVDRPGNTAALIEFIKKWDKKRNVKIEDYMPEWKGIIDYD